MKYNRAIMTNDYSEEKLIQDTAGDYLRDCLGWEVAYAFNDEKLGEDGTFGRTSYKEVLLKRYLKEALIKLNPWINISQISEVFNKLEHKLSSSSLLQINEEKYFLIRNGVDVTVESKHGHTKTRTAKLIDFSNPLNNHFLAIKELQICGDVYGRRTDTVGFVNGIPLVFMEFKRNDKDVKNAYIRNFLDYKDTIPRLFYYNAFLIFSNGTDARVGTLGSSYDFFHEWKRLEENDNGKVALETMLAGICDKKNLLDIFENFILYDYSGSSIKKIMPKNHQYLGVNNAIKSYENRKNKAGKLGVFWHTQGSGKSYSMLFLTQKIKRKFLGTPTFVIVTDRDELNKQISETFENCGLLGRTKSRQYIATSGGDLIQKLKGNPSYIFTLIQKFNKPKANPIHTKHDIIVISDEAHRSQYGTFADNMMHLLPDSSRYGFTGTPLLKDDNITARTFGDYISIYDFQRAVEDKATVPLFYENRGEKLANLHNPEINAKILQAIEDADIDNDQQEKLEKQFAHEIHLLTAEPRLKAIAKDFVKHYSEMWKTGKAMFVCLNKVTCVRMYNFVQEYWAEEIKALESQIKHSTNPRKKTEDQKKLAWMKETEMAVVISQEQNEIRTFEKWGLDILPHRKTMVTRELDKEYKDKNNPFRIVFVCAMWLTGFDVKSLSCMYFDKPLKAHTLMQAIARANRVDEGKSNGLIIDYIGIVKELNKALADYARQNGKNKIKPTIDKSELIAKVKETILLCDNFLRDHGFNLDDLVNAEGFDKLRLILRAANVVCATQENKKIFSTYSYELIKLYKFIERGELDPSLHDKYAAIVAIDREIHKKIIHADTTDLQVEINKIVNQYVKIDSGNNLAPADTKKFDISKIDFNLLSAEFDKTNNKNLVIRDLESVIEHKLDLMLKENKNRIDYYERYQYIIDQYNQTQDSAAIEKTFKELMRLASDLTTEEKRYIREGFDNDEELAVYDLLFKENLDKKDIKKIKKVSKELLSKIKDKIAQVDHWTDKQETKADIENLIRNYLWEMLPQSYDNECITKCRKDVYEYAFVRFGSAA